jgi:hypothetical protein
MNDADEARKRLAAEKRARKARKWARADDKALTGYHPHAEAQTGQKPTWAAERIFHRLME